MAIETNIQNAQKRGSGVVLYASVLLGAFWSVIGLLKTLRMKELSDVITSVLPAFRSVSVAIAICFVLLEIVAGLLILFKKTTHIGLILSLGLASTYAGVNFIRFSDGIKVPCSCFGPLFKVSPLGMIFVNIGICLVTATLLKKRGELS